jgi:glycosyltransferase involved in cell wall biosynthesis
MYKTDISIIITNYNKSKFIDRSIRSCISQLTLRKNIEVIVVDDKSTDDSVSVISEFVDDIKLIKNVRNMGVAYSSNVGLKTCSGEYYMRVDADDFISNLTCEIFHQVLSANTEYDFVYADHYRIDVRGFKIDKVKLDNENNVFKHGAGMMFRTSKLTAIGGYDESLRNCEDFDLLFRLKKSGSVGYYIPIPLYRYYIHGNNLTLEADRNILWEKVEKKYGI